MEKTSLETNAIIEAAVGVELNRLVAERVMGWSDLRGVGQTGALFGRHPRWGDDRMQVPGYATIATASAKVAEEMVNRQFEFILTRTQQPAAGGSKRWYEATFILWARRETDPEIARSCCRHEEEAVAVCRAALLALNN